MIRAEAFPSRRQWIVPCCLWFLLHSCLGRNPQLLRRRRQRADVAQVADVRVDKVVPVGCRGAKSPDFRPRLWVTIAWETTGVGMYSSPFAITGSPMAASVSRARCRVDPSSAPSCVISSSDQRGFISQPAFVRDPLRLLGCPRLAHDEDRARGMMAVIAAFGGPGMISFAICLLLPTGLLSKATGCAARALLLGRVA